MRVLMFGWEFPPHIAGGLGTACYGIVKGLVKNEVETIFVMPSASGDEDRQVADIVNASDVPVQDSVQTYSITTKKVNSKTTLKMHLARSGGFAIRIQKVEGK